MMNQIFYTKKCSSTNDEIIHYLPNLKKIEDEWITLYTFDQTNGRGQTYKPMGYSLRSM